MLIIVEGANKVGKSTFISKLKKMHNTTAVYNRDIRKLMKDPKQEGLITALCMIDVLEATTKNQNVILDRFHLSEFVYGIERGYHNDEMFSVVDKRLAESGLEVMLVLITSDFGHVHDTKLNFEETRAYKTKLVTLQGMFLQAFSKSKIKNKVQIRLEDIQ